MNIAIWIITAVIAAAFIAAGFMKVTQPKEKLAASGMTWTEDFSAPNVKLIGLAQFLGGLGLILPAVTGIAPILVPIAATGLALVMAGAVVWHLRAGDAVAKFVPSATLGVLALIVAITRFGPWAF
jgi:uncharacterized membrane protein YphA (DoxX/SURF4 family)